LRGVINVDPDHEEAKALLGEVIPAQQALAEANPIQDDLAGDEDKNSNRSRMIAMITFGVVATALVLFFAFRPSKPEASEEKKEDSAATKPTAASPEGAETGSFEFYVLPQTGVQLSVDGAAAQPLPPKLDLPAGPHTLTFSAVGYASETLNEPIIAGQSKVVPMILKSTSTTAASPHEKKNDTPPKNDEPPKTTSSSRGSSAAPKSPSDKSAQPASGGVSEGSLAISSAVPVEVFLGSKILGTTPITVKLPTGAQTLEYRFQSQTKSTSYMIRPNETTSAIVSFDVKIRIQAQPWAEVTIDGPEGKDLGQTPLSNILVPAGSWLVFKHPSFPEKRERVSGEKESIAVQFP